MRGFRRLPGDPPTALRPFVVRVRIVIGIATLVLLALWLASQVVQVFLLAFAGLLVAVALDSLADALADHTPLARGWALALVLLALALALVGGLWILGAQVAQQIDQIGAILPQAVAQVRAWLDQYTWGRRLLDVLPPPGALLQGGSPGGAVGQVLGTFSGAVDVIVNSVLVLVVGVFLAISPDLYTRGVLTLVPPGSRDRVGAVLAACGHTLRNWLRGQLALMVLVGVIKGLGLWVIGVPFAPALGLLAGLLEFVPNIGPLTAGTVATLIALTQSPQQAVYVVLFTIVLQGVESNVLEPVVQQQAVKLPPALLIVTQVVVTTLFGFVGLLVATPLLAVTVVAVRMLYVEDVLGDRAAAAAAG